MEINRLRSQPQTLYFTAALSPPSSPLVFSPIHSPPAASRDKWPSMICVFLSQPNIFFLPASPLCFFFKFVFVCSFLHLQPSTLLLLTPLFLPPLFEFFPSSLSLLAVLPCIRRGGSYASNVNGVWYIWRRRAFVVVACLSYQSAWRRDKVASIRGAISHGERKGLHFVEAVSENILSAVDNLDISSCKDNVCVFCFVAGFLAVKRREQKRIEIILKDSQEGLIPTLGGHHILALLFLSHCKQSQKHLN